MNNKNKQKLQFFEYSSGTLPNHLTDKNIFKFNNQLETVVRYFIKEIIDSKDLFGTYFYKYSDIVLFLKKFEDTFGIKLKFNINKMYINKIKSRGLSNSVRHKIKFNNDIETFLNFVKHYIPNGNEKEFLNSHYFKITFNNNLNTHPKQGAFHNNYYFFYLNKIYYIGCKVFKLEFITKSNIGASKFNPFNKLSLIEINSRNTNLGNTTVNLLIRYFLYGLIILIYYFILFFCIVSFWYFTSQYYDQLNEFNDSIDIYKNNQEVTKTTKAFSIPDGLFNGITKEKYCPSHIQKENPFINEKIEAILDKTRDPINLPKPRAKLGNSPDLREGAGENIINQYNNGSTQTVAQTYSPRTTDTTVGLGLVGLGNITIYT